MPTATSFTALGRGNGFPLCIPEFNCTIGSSSIYHPDIEDYITLGGFKGSDGGTPSQTQLNTSFVNAMKLFWNLHGLNVTSGLVSADAASNISKTVAFTYEEPTGTFTNYSYTASASSSATLPNTSFPSVTSTSDSPNDRICDSSRDWRSEWARSALNDNESNSDSDSGTGGGSSVLTTSGSGVEGLGSGPPYDFYFQAKPFPEGYAMSIRRFMDSGNFVGYGILPMIRSAAYSVGCRATGSGAAQPDSSCNAGISIDLSSVVFEETVGQFEPTNIEINEVTVSGIPFYFITGFYGSTSEVTMTVEGKKVTFVGLGSTLDDDVNVENPSDSGKYTNRVNTTTVSNSSSFKFEFEIDALDFYTYS
jgi:hypothetical protein